MRRVYEYLSKAEKEEVVNKLKDEQKKLEKELKENLDSFSPLVRDILQSTQDKWNLEIEELEMDINS